MSYVIRFLKSKTSSYLGTTCCFFTNILLVVAVKMSTGRGYATYCKFRLPEHLLIEFRIESQRDFLAQARYGIRVCNNGGSDVPRTKIGAS